VDSLKRQEELRMEEIEDFKEGFSRREILNQQKYG
jgi:hypothetical protein